MIANRLKDLREKSGLNQTQASEKLGLSRVNYNRYENGEREPDNATLTKIADFFGVTTDYLLGRTDQLVKVIPLSIDTLTQDYPDEEVVKLLQDGGIRKIELVKDLTIEELKALIELKNTIRAQHKKENNHE